MLKKKHILIIKYLLCFILLFIAGKAKLFNIMPFGTGLFLALSFLNLNIIILSCSHVLASILANPTWSVLIAGIVVAVITVAAKLLAQKFKKSFNAPLMAGTAIIAQLGYIITEAVNKKGFLPIFLCVFLSLLFMYTAFCFFRPVILNKLKYKLLEYELICGGIVAVVLALGLSYCNIMSFSLISLVGCFAICLASYIDGARSGLSLGICLGIGCALKNFDITMIACFSLVSLLIVIFSSAPRIFSALSGTIAYIMFVFFFNVDYSKAWITALAFLSGGMLYVLLPKKIIDKVREFFSNTFSKTALRYIVNHSRYEVGNSLAVVSEIFYEMSGLMSGLKNNLGENQISAVKAKIEADCCYDCPLRNECSGSKAMREALEKVAEVSLDKGRATIVDIPAALTETCNKIAGIISSAADSAQSFTKLLDTVENENLAKKIVSEQLKGVSQILKDMGLREAKPLSYDVNRERIIMEELTYRNVICSEAMVTGVDNPTEITLVVLNGCININIIEKVLSRIMKKCFTVTESEESILSGWSIVHAKTSPDYDVVFGYAACAKNKGEASGDTHSFIKIGNDKFMMALCDGMGSGDKAKAFSEATISLIENFYKAGFEHTLVLSSVNKFLSLSGDETFSAVDVCVVDLNTGFLDIIKIGSAPSYIKKKETVQKIEGSALPIGVLDEMRPSVSSHKVETGDIVLLTTDGISECYDQDALAETINNYDGTNPQRLCEALTERALNRCNNNPPDDMTIAAFRFISRI